MKTCRNVICFGLLAGFSAVAQDPRPEMGRPPRPPQGRARPQMRPSLVATALDADQDGTISASEIKNAPAVLRSLDKNGDGKITLDEVRAADDFRGNRGPGEQGPENRGKEGAGFDVTQAVANLMQFDKNGDGKLSKDELPERMQGMIARADANKDGFLTTAELTAMFQAQEAAANTAGPGDRPREQMNPIQFDPLLKALDADHDGVISAEEIRNASSALLSLDKNGDGQLTADEWRMVPPNRQRQ